MAKFYCLLLKILELCLEFRHQLFVVPPMIPLQLRIVQETFAKIENHLEQFSALFYERLFQIDPGTRPLFHSDVKLQHTFAKVLGEVIILRLRSLIFLPATAKATAAAIIPGAYWSGRLHHGYGVSPGHFETMKRALIDALRHQLGAEFTEDVKEAWSQAYDILSAAMQKGLHGDNEALSEDAGDKSDGPVYQEREANEVSALFDRLNRR